MTVYVPENRAEFLGNGVTTQFDFGFRFFADSNIRVTRVDADGLDTVLSAGYVVAGAGSLNGGSVTITSPVLATGERLIVERILPAVQETDIRNQGRFFPEVHEDAWDYLTMLIQQNAGGLRQAIRVAASDPEPARLPNAASRANLLMGFNSSGDPVPVAPVSGSAADLALQLLNAIDPAKGAAMIGYRGQTVFDKLNYIVDVKDHGAVGDYDPSALSGTDNTDAFQDAIDLLAARGGGTLYIPAGYYLVAGELTAVDVPIRIQGDGESRSLIHSNTNDADVFTLTATTQTTEAIHGGRGVCLIVKDLSFTTSAFPRSAVQFIGNETYYPVFGQVQLFNVSIRSVNYTLSGFIYGFYGQNVQGSLIDGFHYDGDQFHHLDGSGSFVTLAGIRLTGSVLPNPNHNNPSHFWNRMVIIAADNAVHVDDWYEGLYVTNFEFVFCNRGWYHIGDPTYGATDVVLTNGHINTYLRGIVGVLLQSCRLTSVEMLRQYGGADEYMAVELNQCNNFEWSGGRVYSFIASPTANEFGVVMATCADFKVRGVSFNYLKNAAVRSDACIGGDIDSCSFRASTDAAIDIINGSSSIDVTNNKFLNIQAGSDRFMIVLDSSTERCLVDGNSDDGTPDLLLVNNSNNNRVGVNYGVGTGYALFTSGDTTPQIDAVGARSFSTANAVATSIQGFDGGFVGMPLTLFAGDANTTLVNSGSGTVPLALAGGANAVMPNGSCMQFVRTNVAWKEVSRSF